ncbi:MAG: hypothetical protein WD336_09905, partial [Trueperaceae bacterium]
MPIALDVLLPLPIGPLRWLAPYREDGTQEATVETQVGRRAVVPWRGGPRVGVITGAQETSGTRTLELKDAIDLLDDAPWLPAATTRWLLREAERTVCPAGVVLAGLHLPGLRVELDHHVRILAAHGPGDAVADDRAYDHAHDRADDGTWRPASELDPERLEALREDGLLLERVTEALPSERVLVPAVPASDLRLDDARRAPQRAALALLHDEGQASSGRALAEAAGVPVATVRSLVRNAFARYEARPRPDPGPPAGPTPRPWPDGSEPEAGDPTDGGPPPTWIEGGTRSRRLRRFVAAFRDDLRSGRSPLVLAPERVLAEEAAAWLANDLPVVALPADLSAPERRAWDRRVREGPPAVLVGTWGILAAPLQRSGQ